MSPKIIVPSAVICLAVLLRGAFLLQGFQLNSGYAILNRTDKDNIWGTSTMPNVGVAQRIFLASLEYEPPRASAWRGLGFVFMMQGQSQQAIEAWKNARYFDQELVQWGMIDETREDLLAAMEKYQLAIDISPELADGWYFSGRIYERLNQPELAQVQYETGLKQRLFLNEGQGDFYFRLGQIAASAFSPEWETAVSFYDRALDSSDFKEVREAQIRYARGVALRRIGKPEEAIADFAWAIKIEPDHYWATVHLGMLTWLVTQDAEKAEQLLQHAIEIAPEKSYGYLNLAQFYQLTNRKEDAVRIYKNLLLKDPTNQEAHEQLNSLVK